MLRGVNFAPNAELYHNGDSDDSTSIGSSRPSSPSPPANDTEGVSHHLQTNEDEAEKGSLAAAVGGAHVAGVMKEGAVDMDVDMHMDAEEPVPGLRLCVGKRSPPHPRAPVINSKPKPAVVGSGAALNGHGRAKVEATDGVLHRTLSGSKLKTQAQGDLSFRAKAESGRATDLGSPPHPDILDKRMADVHEHPRRDHALSESSMSINITGASSQQPETQMPSSSCGSLVDAMHARPSLQMTAQEFSEAKMIILDLLGWGVPSEYLLRCGLARKSIYYAFTELNLRLPTGFDTEGIVPYEPPPHYSVPR